MDTATQLSNAIIEEFSRRVARESVPRIKKCLGLLDEEEIWHQPNESLNSVGNLILHLCGNARQWILSGIGGQADERDRDSEFMRKGHVSKADLTAMLDQLLADIDLVLQHIQPDTLLEVFPVQAFQESVLSMLVHVIEHFSYHTGQITFLTKSLKNVDTAYYGHVDLKGKGNIK